VPIKRNDDNGLHIYRELTFVFNNHSLHIYLTKLIRKITIYAKVTIYIVIYLLINPLLSIFLSFSLYISMSGFKTDVNNSKLPL
jgi:hypothetical protein